MEAICESAARRRDNLIHALSGTAWPYCLSMSAALPENMRGFALSAMVIKLASRGQTGRVLAALWQYACVDASTACRRGGQRQNLLSAHDVGCLRCLERIQPVNKAGRQLAKLAM